MYKVMIIIAVLVGVLAIGGVAAVMVFKGRAPAQNEPETSTATVASVPAPAASLKAKTTKKPAKKPVGVAQPAESDDSAMGPIAGTDVAATDTAPAGAGAATDVTAEIIKNLSPDQENQLLRALQDRERERRRQEMRYGLPSNSKIAALKNLNNPALKVSDAQQQRLSVIQDTLKPRMEAALNPIVTRLDEIGQSMRNAFQNAQTDEERQAARQQMDSYRSEMQDLMQKSDAIKQQFDQQFMSSAQSVLSTDQMAAIQAMPTSTAGRPFGGPGGGARGGRGGGAGAGG